MANYILESYTAFNDVSFEFYAFRISYPGLNITAGHRTMTGQNWLLTVHFFTSPVILTGRIFIPFPRILNRFFSAYDVCWNIVKEKLYISSRVRNFTVSMSIYVWQNWQRLSIYIRMLGFVIQVIIYISRPGQERLRKMQHKVLW
jgi:hypothetical protein